MTHPTLIAFLVGVVLGASAIAVLAMVRPLTYSSEPRGGFQSFLDSLATRGGNLLILCFFVFISGFAMNRIHKSDEIDTVMVSVFSGFCGALLQALSHPTWRRVRRKGAEPEVKEAMESLQ